VQSVVVGVVAGTLSALGAALVEAILVTTRFITLGQHGGSVGNGLLVVIVLGALCGALTGLVVGGLFTRKSKPTI
jgi:hypothetical protein